MKGNLSDIKDVNDLYISFFEVKAPKGFMGEKKKVKLDENIFFDRRQLWWVLKKAFKLLIYLIKNVGACPKIIWSSFELQQYVNKIDEVPK